MAQSSDEPTQSLVTSSVEPDSVLTRKLVDIADWTKPLRGKPRGALTRRPRALTAA